MSGEFTCECCKGTFVNGWSDREAKAEADALFPDVPDKERAIVCDACYDRIMTWMQKNGHA